MKLQIWIFITICFVACLPSSFSFAAESPSMDATPNLEGVAVWLPYVNKEFKLILNIGCLLKSKMYKMGREAGKRIKPIEEHNTNVHREFAPGDHWYLQTLGV